MCTRLDFAAIYEKHINGWNIHIIPWGLGGGKLREIQERNKWNKMKWRDIIVFRIVPMPLNTALSL